MDGGCISEDVAEPGPWLGDGQFRGWKLPAHRSKPHSREVSELLHRDPAAGDRHRVTQ